MTNFPLNELMNGILDFFHNSVVGFVVLVLIVFSSIHKVSSTLVGAWIMNLFGVFFHEIMHAGVGKILLAQPTNFTIFPQKIKTDTGVSYILGNVKFANIKWYNALPSAMAPLVLLFIAFFIENNFWKYFEYTLLNYLLYVYLLIVFIINAIPSSQDFKVGFSNVFGVIFWILFTSIMIYFLNIYSISIDF